MLSFEERLRRARVAVNSEKEAHATTRTQLVRSEATVAALQARLGERAPGTAETPPAEAGVDRAPHQPGARERTCLLYTSDAADE